MTSTTKILSGLMEQIPQELRNKSGILLIIIDEDGLKMASNVEPEYVDNFINDVVFRRQTIVPILYDKDYNQIQNPYN